MKILIFRTHPSKINIRSYNCQEIGLAASLIRRGVQCDVAFYTDEESFDQYFETSDHIRVHLYWIHGKKFLWQGLYNYRELASLAGNYDVVQTNEYNQVASYRISADTNIKSLIYHGPYQNNSQKKENLLTSLFDALFLRKYMQIQPRILAKSALAGNYLIERGFVNVVTTGVGLDATRFSVKSPFKRTIEGNQKQRQILYVGELTKRRNILFLLKVFFGIHEKAPDTTLLLVGRGTIQYLRECREFVKSKSLTHVVKFKDSISQKELPETYLNSDLFLFPTEYDIFGMVLLESMYFGIPIISSVNGGSATTMTSPLLKDLVLSHFSVNKWVATALRILSDSNYASAVSAEEHATIVDHFEWDDLAERFISQYELVLRS